jgi:hypothetical protein
MFDEIDKGDSRAVHGKKYSSPTRTKWNSPSNFAVCPVRTISEFSEMHKNGQEIHHISMQRAKLSKMSSLLF